MVHLSDTPSVGVAIGVVLGAALVAALIAVLVTLAFTVWKTNWGGGDTAGRVMSTSTTTNTDLDKLEWFGSTLAFVPQGEAQPAVGAKWSVLVSLDRTTGELLLLHANAVYLATVPHGTDASTVITAIAVTPNTTWSIKTNLMEDPLGLPVDRWQLGLANEEGVYQPFESVSPLFAALLSTSRDGTGPVSPAVPVQQTPLCLMPEEPLLNANVSMFAGFPPDVNASTMLFAAGSVFTGSPIVSNINIYAALDMVRRKWWVLCPSKEPLSWTEGWVELIAGEAPEFLATSFYCPNQSVTVPTCPAKMCLTLWFDAVSNRAGGLMSGLDDDIHRGDIAPRFQFNFQQWDAGFP